MVASVEDSHRGAAMRMKGIAMLVIVAVSAALFVAVRSASRASHRAPGFSGRSAAMHSWAHPKGIDSALAIAFLNGGPRKGICRAP
jgi:hypothetical protein